MGNDSDPARYRGPPGHARNAGDSSNRPLIALLIFIALAIAGWFLVRAMMRESRLQDCVMSGRRNCAPIESAKDR